MASAATFHKPTKPNKRSFSTSKSSKYSELRIVTDTDQIQLLRRENESLKLQVAKLQMLNDGNTKNFEVLFLEQKTLYAKKLKELELVVLSQQGFIEKLRDSLNSKPSTEWEADVISLCSSVDPRYLMIDTQDSSEVPITLESSFSKTLSQRQPSANPNLGKMLEAPETVKLKDFPTLANGVTAAYKQFTSEEGKCKEFINALSAKLNQHLSRK